MAEKTYLDFDLSIECIGKNYKARVINSPAGQAVVDFSLPFSDVELENFLLKLGRPRRGVRHLDSSEMGAAKELGSRLFKAVFDDDVRGCLDRSLAEAQQRDTGLRIRLRTTDAPKLYDLPWEYLYNPSLNRFFSLSILTPIVRYIDLPESIHPLTVQHPLRVLVMISSPYNFPKLEIEEEWHKITESLSHLERQGLVELDKLKRATLPDLQQQLRQNDYHIFHFIGHGGFDKQSDDGVLILEDEQKQGRPMSGQYLGALLHNHRSLRLAILNACEGARASQKDPFAGTAQSLVQQGIPAVIAMQFEITDQAAVTFSQTFYSAISDNYPVDAALVEARTAIFSQGNDVEWGTPVLYMRSPDGCIFDLNKMSTEEQRQTQMTALNRKAQTAIGIEDWPNAARLLKELLTLDSNNTGARVSLNHVEQEQKLAALYAKGYAYYEKERWAKALEYFQQVREIKLYYKQVDDLIARITRTQNEQKRHDKIIVLIVRLFCIC